MRLRKKKIRTGDYNILSYKLYNPPLHTEIYNFNNKIINLSFALQYFRKRMSGQTPQRLIAFLKHVYTRRCTLIDKKLETINKYEKYFKKQILLTLKKQIFKKVLCYIDKCSYRNNPPQSLLLIYEFIRRCRFIIFMHYSLLVLNINKKIKKNNNKEKTSIITNKRKSYNKYNYFFDINYCKYIENNRIYKKYNKYYIYNKIFSKKKRKKNLTIRQISFLYCYYVNHYCKNHKNYKPYKLFKITRNYSKLKRIKVKKRKKSTK
jgi:hypothetical protein